MYEQKVEVSKNHIEKVLNLAFDACTAGAAPFAGEIVNSFAPTKLSLNLLGTFHLNYFYLKMQL